MATTTLHHNAKTVLPPGLLAEVQRFVSGHLWVPAAERQTGQLRQRIVHLHQAGVATRDIAALVRLSQRRVQQVIRAAQQEGAPHAE